MPLSFSVMRLLGSLAALAVVVAACGGSATPEPTSPAGPPAPDFVLELSGGSVFVLSQEQKPVYLVFWAEW